jgi:hypothetical protein
MRGVGIQTGLRPRGRGDDDITMMEKDFYLNVLVILLLLVGGGVASALAAARTPAPGAPRAPSHTIKIYIEDDGDLHFGSLSSPHVMIKELEQQLKVATKTKATGEPLSVLIHHTAQTPAGFVHEVLRAVGQVPGTESLLALSRYGALPCEEQARKESPR